MDVTAFEQRAQLLWTPERLAKVTGGRKLLFLPTNAPTLLRALGILNSDATMSSDSMRKFVQINHMIDLLKPGLEDLKERQKIVRIIDCGCGNSYLTFLVAWLFSRIWQHPVEILGIDTNAKLIDKCTQRANLLGLTESLTFATKSVAQCAEELQLSPDRRIHAVIALHACDTATDDALALALGVKADLIAVAPCCQAELAAKWRALSTTHLKHSLGVLMNSPELRRDSCATFTDALRMLLLRGAGYETTSTEFVPSQHTPKNRLILAEKRGRYLDSALSEYLTLKETLGQVGIKLEEHLPEEPALRLAAMKV